MSYVNSITIYPRQITMRKEDYYYNVRVEVCPSNADKDLIWAVSDESIIEYNQTGRYIYAKKNGTAYLRAYATDGSGVVGCCKVTVHTNVNIETITLDRTDITIEKGDCAILTASICPPNATNKSLRWYANHSNVSVENGVVRGLSEGTAIVTARAMDIGSASATCTVHVTERILVNSIDLNFSTLLLDKGDTQVLYATVCPSNATDKSLNWYSSDATTVHVNRHTGVITAQEVGTATITAVAADGSGVYAQCVVTVQQFIPVRAICICDPCGPLTVGDEFYLNTSITPENATDQSLMWESSNPSVVSVGTYTGYISAVSRGTAVITARTFNGSVSKSISLTVTRERVSLIDNDCYYTISFCGGTVLWKCVDFDMSNNTIIPSDVTERYNYNASHDYSEEQLAYIFLIDPFGVIHYLEYYYLHHSNSIPYSGDEKIAYCLLLKDRVFEKIFGNKPLLFNVTYNQITNLRPYNDGITIDTRYNVYSTAEVLFGMHAIVDNSFFDNVISDILYNCITNIPVLSETISALRFIYAVFYAGAISGDLDGIGLILSYAGILSGDADSITELFDWKGWLFERLIDSIIIVLENLTPPQIVSANTYQSLANNNYYVLYLISNNTIIKMSDFIT